MAEVQAHMEAMGQEMTQLLLSTRDTLLQHGPTKIQQPSGHHYRPRQVNKQRHRLATLRKLTITTLRKASMGHTQVPEDIQEYLKTKQVPINPLPPRHH
jgi:hypothetical protein